MSSHLYQLLQVTRVYKGREHAEVEFIVSSTNSHELVYIFSTHKKKKKKNLVLRKYMRQQKFDFRLGQYLLMIELVKRSLLRLQLQSKMTKDFIQILMAGIS